jgi:hypothetical protein
VFVTAEGLRTTSGVGRHRRDPSAPSHEPHDGYDSPLAIARAAQRPSTFNFALNQLRLRQGRSYGQISLAAGPRELPKSTAHSLCAPGKNTLPARAELVRLFVIGCGQSAEQAQDWVLEWDRLAASVRAHRFAARQSTARVVGARRISQLAVVAVVAAMVFGVSSSGSRADVDIHTAATVAVGVGLGAAAVVAARHRL